MIKIGLIGCGYWGPNLIRNFAKIRQCRIEAIAGTEVEIPAELVLLAMGFVGPEKLLAEQFELELDTRGNIARDVSYATTPRFLAMFQLRSLDDLPRTQELERL